MDSIRPEGKLFFHAVRKRDFTVRERWTVVEYGLPLMHDLLARARRVLVEHPSSAI